MKMDYIQDIFKEWLQQITSRGVSWSIISLCMLFAHQQPHICISFSSLM